MDTLIDIWQWFPQFTKGDLPSWLAVAIAMIAVWFATRKPSVHTELRFSRLHFDSDGGPISLELELTTYSHARRIVADAKLKLNGTSYPMDFEPFETPQNYAFATVNTFHLVFKGTYVKSQKPPKTAFIDVKAKLSDGAKARYREKNMELTESKDD